jgi:hypothetical protein
MHKEERVLDFSLDDYGNFNNIYDIYDKAQIPFGVHVDNVHGKFRELNLWWNSRALPEQRLRFSNSLLKYDIHNSKELLAKGLGLSLTDQYWIKPYNQELLWKDVNYFANEYSNKLGLMFLKNDVDVDLQQEDFLTPDTSVGGNLEKRWEKRSGISYLLKSGSGFSQQEPINEAFISLIYKTIDTIPFVEYEIERQGNYFLSVCKDFITSDTEFIPAYFVINEEKKKNDISYLEQYKNICKEKGLENIDVFLDTMLTIDYIVANQDRHLNNLGIIRDANTLEWISPAPVFDNGNSLWFNIPTADIKGNGEVKTTSFYDTDEQMLKHIEKLPDLDYIKIKGLSEKLSQLLTDANMDSERVTRICEGFEYRVDVIREKRKHLG